MTRTIRSVCLALCFSFLITLCLPCRLTGAESAAPAGIEVVFRTMFSPEKRTWTFPYDDAFFVGDADEYAHPLAQASLGLALASGRQRGQPKDVSIRSFLTQAGFTELEGTDYDIATSQETIASMIAHKTLPNGDTLLVVGVSGFGYGNEWLGNLDVGDGEEHRGFSTAAEKVSARVLTYMEKHGLGEKCRLWISGYSRAAAVSNLVAARLMELGVFDSKTAFVYTFATPRTTQNPVAYPNIFNIVGKFDPATKLPYQEWGFGRHGVNLFTPAQETDSDYRQKREKSSAIFEQLTGIPYQNSTDVNHNFTIIAEYLISIIPTSAYYDAQMYEHMQKVWQDPNLNSLRMLVSALSAPVEVSTLTDMEQRQQVDNLIDYLSGIVYGLISDSLLNTELSTNDGVAALLQEHIPEVYVAWLFSSDDPQEIFSEHMNYVHLVLDGDAEVTLFDQKGSFVLRMDTKGNCTEETDVERFQKRLGSVEERPLIASSGMDLRRLVLPKDQGMPFVMEALSDDDFLYYGVLYHIEECMPTATRTRMIQMEEGQYYLAYSFTEEGMRRMGADDHVWGDADTSAVVADDGKLLSIGVAADFEDFDDVSINVKAVLLTMLGIAVVVLLAVLLGTIFLIRLIWKKLIRRAAVHRSVPKP